MVTVSYTHLDVYKRQPILRLVIDRRIDTLRGRAAGAFFWSVREILFNDIINPRLIFDDLREDKYISRHDEIPTALVNLHAVAVVFLSLIHI